MRRNSGVLEVRHLPLLCAVTGSLLLVLFFCMDGHAQSNAQSPGPRNVGYSAANEYAKRTRQGDLPATVALTHHVFENIAFSADFADFLGFTDRIAKAEIAYRNGTLQGVSESDVIHAINNLSSSLGTPVWTRTTPEEIRALHVKMAVVLPEVFVYQGPADKQGKRSLLHSSLSPIEAAYLGTTLFYMKVFNPEYQFTKEELAQKIYRDPGTRGATARERSNGLLELLKGNFGSGPAPDVFGAADHFLTDLGIPPSAQVALNRTLNVHGSTLQVKGGR